MDCCQKNIDKKVKNVLKKDGKIYSFLDVFHKKNV